MSNVKRTPRDAEFRTCTCCGETFPNTKEYFAIVNGGKIGSVCRSCLSIKKKEYNKKRKERFETNEIEYDGEKRCAKCGIMLPNTFRYFPTDKTTSTVLRDICRKCNPKYGHFIAEDKGANQKWTDEENDLLKQVHMDYSGKELQELFFQRHTLNSVRTQIQLLKLRGKSELGIISGNKYRSNEINELTGNTYYDEWRNKLSSGIREYYKTHDGIWKNVKRPEISRLMSELHKGNWVGDKNPRHIYPLNGSENGNWRGGITSTYLALRSYIKDWIRNSAEFCKCKCVLSGDQIYVVHHTKSFSEIIDDVFNITNIQIKNNIEDYSNDEILILNDCISMLHEFYGYGACLNENIHKLFHSVYGYKEFTSYDFLDFIYRIDCGEFDDWFAENNLSVNIDYEYVSYLESILQEMKSA